MNLIIYKNRKKILVISVLLIVIGLIMAYVKYGIEPWETIGGAFCGIGLSFAIISLSLKKPELNRS